MYLSVSICSSKIPQQASTLPSSLSPSRDQQVLLPEDLVEAISTKQGSHGHASSVSGLLKSTLLKECHLTPVPRPWYKEDRYTTRCLSSSFPPSPPSPLTHLTLNPYAFTHCCLTPASHLLQGLQQSKYSSLEVCVCVCVCVWLH